MTDIMEYTLMHRDVEVLDIDICEETGCICRIGEPKSPDHVPVGTALPDGSVDEGGLHRWWDDRSIPAARPGVRDLLGFLGMPTATALSAKSLGLSLSDQYWIRPKGSDAEWSHANYFDNGFSGDVGGLLFGNTEVAGEVDTSSPDNTTAGNLRKRWGIVDGKLRLVKAGSGPYMQEAFNETVATLLMKSRGIECAEYRTIWVDGNPHSVCEDFVTRDTELVTAYYVCKMHRRSNDRTLYDHYVECCEAEGLDITPFLDRMIAMDYIMMNTDRHLNNFGIVRDATTLEWLGPAPVYDTGSSLMYDTITEAISADSDPACKPFGKTLGGQLDLVTSFDWLDFDALRGALADVDSVLGSDPKRISDARRKALVGLLSGRIDRLEARAAGGRRPHLSPRIGGM